MGHLVRHIHEGVGGEGGEEEGVPGVGEQHGEAGHAYLYVQVQVKVQVQVHTWPAVAASWCTSWKMRIEADLDGERGGLA